MPPCDAHSGIDARVTNLEKTTTNNFADIFGRLGALEKQMVALTVKIGIGAGLIGFVGVVAGSLLASAAKNYFGLK